MVARDVCEGALESPVKWTFLEQPEARGHLFVFLKPYSSDRGFGNASDMLRGCRGSAVNFHLVSFRIVKFSNDDMVEILMFLLAFASPPLPPPLILFFLLLNER